MKFAICITLSLCCLTTESSLACMAVSRMDAPVRFTHQMNLIVWDPVAKVEHFVRDASFRTEAADLAFIAPTPTVPEMKAVDPKLFGVLERLRKEAENPPRPEATHLAAPGAAFAMAPNAVVVVKEADVAGYHAAVLKADDAQALSQWLSDNGYPLTQAVTEWCQPYISRGWYLTAFKVAANGTAASTGIIRLSFQTSVPFNPYFVPKSNQPRGGEREGLDLYFLSTKLYGGSIGGSQPWIAPEIDFETVASDYESMLGLQSGTLPGNLLATYYKDSSFPREGTDDIYFAPSGRSMVKPAPVDDSQVSEMEYVLNRNQPPARPLDKVATAVTALVTPPKGSPATNIAWGSSLAIVGVGAWLLGRRSGRSSGGQKNK